MINTVADPLDAYKAVLATASKVPLETHIELINKVIGDMGDGFKEISARVDLLPEAFEGKKALRNFVQLGLSLPAALDAMVSKAAKDAG